MTITPAPSSNPPLGTDASGWDAGWGELRLLGFEPGWLKAALSLDWLRRWPRGVPEVGALASSFSGEGLVVLVKWNSDMPCTASSCAGNR